ncbi:MAG: SH3 domain-containing protein [Lachnospiraceae bacterium]|nr:SH3 domain-containing protein [Lachnospiraceae bacterium]
MLLLILPHMPLSASEFYIEPLTGTAVVTADTLNVRSGPSIEYGTIGTLHAADQVSVTGCVEDWYVILYEGQEGYVAGEYVTFTPAAETPSQETPEETPAFSFQTLLLPGLFAAILIVVLLMGLTLRSIRANKEPEEEIPVTSHDDTNMHLGEISYDTFRLDIDPSFFETDTIIEQPESVDSDTEGNFKTLDDKLEEASAQIAALQKEVEELKRGEKIASDP